MKTAELRNITFRYGAGTPFETLALDNVSFDIEEGSITGLIGHTGSGKSTLVQMLNGLIKPLSGNVIVSGRDIWEKPKEIRDVRFEVGLVMQYPEYQLFDETVRSDIAFGPKNMGLSAEEIAQRVRTAAEFVGLDAELLDKSPFDLSGGQKRRAAIAGVMAMKPKLLVLDEPAAGLDPRGREEILGGLRAYRELAGSSILIVSHSMEDVARYCDDIVVMSHGRFFMKGSAGTVFSHRSELESIGLSVPDIAKITEKLRSLGMPLPDDCITVEKAADEIAKLLTAAKTGGGHSAL